MVEPAVSQPLGTSVACGRRYPFTNKESHIFAQYMGY